MKNILITGANSYIGTSFERWLKQYPNDYSIDTVETKNNEWKEKDFSKYDVVFHVAGIAHVDIKKPTEEIKNLYYKVNRDLTIKIAKKSKSEGVKQFVYMSSIIIYGDSSPIGKKRVINRDTIPEPVNFYGDSKLQAELGILTLQSNDFSVVVLRPPMVYGKGSQGNYHKLARLARVCPIWFAIDNERSMIHIDNLCEFIRLIVENEDKGIFFPQNEEYVKTSDMIKEIRGFYNKKVFSVYHCDWILKVLSKKIKIINKVYGNLTYDKKLSQIYNKYCINNFAESIILTENRDDYGK